MNKTLTFNTFARVEGDLSITLDIGQGIVRDARVEGAFSRGINSVLRSRSPMDAIVITCRVCGTCGGVHSAAASAALAHAFGTVPPPNGVRCRNIIPAIEIILSHLTHFFLSFMVEFADPGRKDPDTARFVSASGRSFKRMLQARARFLALLGLMAGKWPNTLVLQPGGSTKTLNSSEISRAGGILAEFVRYLEDDVFGCPLDEWLSVRTVKELEAWAEKPDHAESDLGVFLRVARREGLDALGAGPGRFLSEGGFPSTQDQSLFFPRGYYDGGRRDFDVGAVEECVRASSLENDAPPGEPAGKPSRPAANNGRGGWCRTPRYLGRAAEVGPLARMILRGEPLALDFLNRSACGVTARALMRLHEVALITRQLDEWISQLDPDEPFYVKEQPRDAVGFALQPAPRGVLIHWVDVQDGVIRDYEIVTPSAWNFSSGDPDGAPGPVEQALIGTPVEEERDLKRIAWIVRSFDPCLFCYLH